VKRFAKIILGALGAIVIVLLVVLIGVNLYLQSGDVQQRIRMATEQAVGMPVTVKRTLYLPWSGLTLSGLSLPDPTIPEASLVEAPTFSVKFQFWPLLSRKLVISQVNLVSPHLVLRQTDDKKWVLVPPRRPSTVAEKPSGKPTAPATVRPPAYTVELRYFSIHDGSADIFDRKGVPIARLRGLEFNGNLSAGGRVDGSVWIDDIEIFGLLHPNRLRAEFVQDGDLLTVRDLKCAIAGGKVRADFSVATPRKAPPAFEFRGRVEDVSLPALVSEAHGDESSVTGRLAGEFNLRGDPLDASTLVGGGKLGLDSAQLRPFDIIQQLGVLLNVDELQLLKLREANLLFEIRDERFWMTNLRLKTENLIITGSGPIRFNGKMNLDGRFLINEKIERQLGMFIGNDRFQPATEPGYKEVEFKVTGRTSRPETDLAYKITGFRIGNVGALGPLLKGFFQAPSPEPTNKAARE
jgi:AsmA-like C-terminal region